MNTALHAVFFLIGIVLVYRAGAHIEAMSARSNHLVRIGYYAVAVGGMALVLAPFTIEEWMRQFGLVAVLIGTGLLFCFDRRKVIDRDSERMPHRGAIR